MKRWLIALLAVFALAVPSTAGAAWTNLPKYGVGTTMIDLSDPHSSGAHYYDIWIASAKNQTLRVPINCALNGGDVGAAHGTDLASLASQNIEVLPILVWKDGSGNMHQPTAGAEVTQFRYCAKRLSQVMKSNQATYGNGDSNVIEVWNEPNCESAGAPLGSNGVPYIADFYNNVFWPAKQGIQVDAGNSGTNVIPGGMAFGTDLGSGSQSGYECNDASNWIAAFVSNGWDSGAAAYAIHPYGYTDSSTYVSGGSSAQTHQKAAAEVDRADAATTKPLLCTEFGRRTDVWSGLMAQATFIDDFVDDNLNQCRAIINWPGSTPSGGTTTSSGVLEWNGAAKDGWAEWATHNSGTGVGTL